MIMSSSTGGGHDMRAYALMDWWKSNGGEAQVCHPLEDGFFVYRMGTEFYNFIQRKIPRFHQLYFRFLEYANLHRKPNRILFPRHFTKEISSFSPDLLVSVHAHLNHGFFELASRASRKPLKFAVYCGELGDGIGFSRHWINPRADKFIGPFEETCNAAVSRGMPEEKVEACGLLLRKPFFEMDNELMRVQYLKEIGLNPKFPFLVLATGANEVNVHEKVCRALFRENNPIQVVALCGSNKKLQAKLNHIQVLALPKLDGQEMAFLLRSADCMLGRPGAGLTSEAVACGTPMIFDLTGGVMPQEENNLKFWTKRSTNLLSISKPSELPERLIREVPSIKIKLPENPRKLLFSLESLVINHGSK